MTLQPAGLVWPDAPTECCLYLQGKLDPGVRVAVDLTGWRRPQPSVQIHQRGGQVNGVFERARLQIDVRAETHDATRDLMDVVRAHLLLMAVQVSVVISSNQYVGPQSIPDPDRKPRLMLTWDVTTRGAPLA